MIVLTCAARLSADDMPPVDQAKALSQAFRQAARAVRPAVVTVTSSYKFEPRQSSTDRQRNPGVPGLPRDGEPDAVGRPTSVGSGVVVDKLGIVLTNNHVVQGSQEVKIRLADGREYKIDDIRTDPLSDLAVLRFKPDADVPEAKLGDSSQLDIGDWVIAIGTPFDLESTVSAGIISATGRSMALIPRVRLLQTDAAINPGNSGGPLVDLHGEVVGINTAIATSSGAFQGVGFAVPVNQAKWISSELLAQGTVRRAYLGVTIADLTVDAARKMNLPVRAGVWVQGVHSEGPAGKAGVKIDDVITNFAGVPVRSTAELREVVEQKQFGSTQSLQIIRDGKTISLDVTVVPLPEEKIRRNPEPVSPEEKREDKKSDSKEP